jgi:hypothetical protein
LIDSAPHRAHPTVADANAVRSAADDQYQNYSKLTANSKFCPGLAPSKMPLSAISTGQSSRDRHRRCDGPAIDRDCPVTFSSSSFLPSSDALPPDNGRFALRRSGAGVLIHIGCGGRLNGFSMDSQWIRAALRHCPGSLAIGLAQGPRIPHKWPPPLRTMNGRGATTPAMAAGSLIMCGSRTVPLRDWLAEVDPNILRVGEANRHRYGLAGLSGG